MYVCIMEKKYTREYNLVEFLYIYNDFLLFIRFLKKYYSTNSLEDKRVRM